MLYVILFVFGLALVYWLLAFLYVRRVAKALTYLEIYRSVIKIEPFTHRMNDAQSETNFRNRVLWRTGNNDYLNNMIAEAVDCKTYNQDLDTLDLARELGYKG
uniref:hypothetical protein n=1 Tax=Shewanella gaetbuli TaxID=220752 RepID=UPI003B5A1640